jgi:hypothetical protein
VYADRKKLSTLIRRNEREFQGKSVGLKLRSADEKLTCWVNQEYQLPQGLQISPNVSSVISCRSLSRASSEISEEFRGHLTFLPVASPNPSDQVSCAAPVYPEPPRASRGSHRFQGACQFVRVDEAPRIPHPNTLTKETSSSFPTTPAERPPVPTHRPALSNAPQHCSRDRLRKTSDCNWPRVRQRHILEDDTSSRQVRPVFSVHHEPAPIR